jgi:Lrp/AsnC family leucine-responsive transcriptional regulator
MPKKLRNIERLVLGMLEQDSRQSFSSIGRSIRKSQQRVSYTVNSMMQKGLIQSFYTLIDYSKLNVLNFRVHFRVNYTRGKRFEELVDYLVKHEQTGWVAARGGKYDLVCTFFASNPSRFNKTWKGVLERFPEEIQDYNVMTTIVNLYFGRKYLNSNQHPPKIIVGGDRTPEKLDGIDMRILRGLSESARANSVKLGQDLSLAPKTVIDRMRKLKRRKIILGFRSLISPSEMGWTSYLFFVKYHNVSSDVENAFLAYLKANPHVVRVVKTIGEWDTEAVIEVEDLTEMRRVEMEMRERFTALVKDIAAAPLYRTYKNSFFPAFLAKQ